MMYSLLSRMVVLFVALFFSLAILAGNRTTDTAEDQKARSVEARGDSKFMDRDFAKAMSIYESAFKYSVTADYGAALHLKVARLYMDLSDNLNAVSHYESAMVLSDQAFGVDDVCCYLDALRISGQRMKAIGVSRKFASDESYASDSRYQNRARGLQCGEGYMPVGATEYDFNPIGTTNGSQSAFWIGVKADEFFYAVGSGTHRDPCRRFYAEVNYYTLGAQSKFSIGNSQFKKSRFLPMLPSKLKNGGVSFSQNANRMVVTEICLDKNTLGKHRKLGIPDFQTKLLFSNLDERKNKWSSFRSALSQQAGYSYSHPYIFNDGRSLLFSSNMPGGFGGYDIYVARWDDQAQLWGDPVNLGPLVNTPGNEISPSLYNDMLVFASNGHVGFGGYDVYGITYLQGQAIPGSLTHYDYPVNSISNEFSLLQVDDHSGFVVSDRSESNSDNIYFFDRNRATLSGQAVDSRLVGMSEVQAISTGSINLLTQIDSIVTPQNEALPSNHFEDQVLSVFFDFDSFDLGLDALKELENWKNLVDFSKIDKLRIEGFADEIGRKEYNLFLSGQRARQVCGWMLDNGVNTPMDALAKGQIAVKGPDAQRHIPAQSEEKNSYNFKTLLANKIWMTREARRVDIKVITK